MRARVRAGSSGSCGLQAQLPTSSATAAGRPGQVRSRARKSGRAGDPAIPRLFPFQSGGAFNIVLNSCKGWCQRTVRSDTRFLGGSRGSAAACPKCQVGVPEHRLGRGSRKEHSRTCLHGDVGHGHCRKARAITQYALALSPFPLSPSQAGFSRKYV